MQSPAMAPFTASEVVSQVPILPIINTTATTVTSGTVSTIALLLASLTTGDRAVIQPSGFVNGSGGSDVSNISIADVVASTSGEPANFSCSESQELCKLHPVAAEAGNVDERGKPKRRDTVAKVKDVVDGNSGNSNETKAGIEFISPVTTTTTTRGKPSRPKNSRPSSSTPPPPSQQSFYAKKRKSNAGRKSKPLRSEQVSGDNEANIDENKLNETENVCESKSLMRRRPCESTVNDSRGASYYIIAVLGVYSLSAVMLLATRISRKHTRLQEDRQTRKYLQEFQVVKERSSRDMYRSMKRAIIAKLSRGGGPNSSSSGGGGGGSGGGGGGGAPSIIAVANQLHMHRNLSRAVLPLVAVALPVLPEEDDFTPDSNTGLLLAATAASSLGGSRRPSAVSSNIGVAFLSAPSSIVADPRLLAKFSDKGNGSSTSRMAAGIAESSVCEVGAPLCDSEDFGSGETCRTTNDEERSAGCSVVMTSAFDADVDDDEDDESAGGNRRSRSASATTTAALQMMRDHRHMIQSKADVASTSIKSPSAGELHSYHHHPNGQQKQQQQQQSPFFDVSHANSEGGANGRCSRNGSATQSSRNDDAASGGGALPATGCRHSFSLPPTPVRSG